MINNAEREAFQKAYGDVIKALADIVANAPQTDEQCEAELIPRPYVMDRVVRIRQAMDALSKEWQASAHTSGVPDGWQAATEDDKKSGWSWSFVWMEQLQEMAEYYGFSPGLEEIDALLSVLSKEFTSPKSASVPVERLEAFISQHGADATHACDEYEVLASLKELIAEYKALPLSEVE